MYCLHMCSHLPQSVRGKGNREPEVQTAAQTNSPHNTHVETAQNLRDMMSDSDDEFSYHGDGDREEIACLLPFEAAKVRLEKNGVWRQRHWLGEKSRIEKIASES